MSADSSPTHAREAWWSAYKALVSVAIEFCTVRTAVMSEATWRQSLLGNQ
jgi:hypothetical protein